MEVSENPGLLFLGVFLIKVPSHTSSLARSGTLLTPIHTELSLTSLIKCNPELSALISKTLKLDKSVWLKDLTRLEGLLPFVEDKKFRAQWAAIKQRNKERLANYVQKTLGFIIRTDAMFDVQIKVRYYFLSFSDWEYLKY